MDRFDRRLEAISKLIQQAKRTLAETAVARKRPHLEQRRIDIALAELAQAQKETQRSLKAFINSRRRGRRSRIGN